MKLTGPEQTLAWQSLRDNGNSGILVWRIDPHGESRPHDHVFHEIAFVERGTAEHITVAGTHKLRPGDLIILRPQVWHGYHRPRGLGIINILIDRSIMQRVGPLLQGVAGAFELFRQRLPNPRHTPPVVLHANPTDRVVLLGRLEAIIAEERSRRNGWQASSMAGLLDVLVTMARLSQNQHATETRLPDVTEQAVLDVASHIESHFAAPASLTDLAKMVDLSPAHLSRSFSKRMGCGIVQYMHRMRVEEACRMLRLTSEKISTIAQRVGYDEIAYFSRCFRAQTEMSPRAYRRINR